MTIDPKLNHRISLVIHSLGLSCLGGAIFLQILVFSAILTQGYFKAVETSPSILSLEMILTAFTAIYFIYVYQRVIRATFK
jgi:membrane protein implicated in regulation of membrane protease activity